MNLSNPITSAKPCHLIAHSLFQVTQKYVEKTSDQCKDLFFLEKLTADSYTLFPVFVLILEQSEDFPS